MVTAAAWAATWRLLGLASPPLMEFQRLTAAYSTPDRAYHNLHHLDECFNQFKIVSDQVSHPGAVGLAIWFHDVVYDSRRSDNEDQSAVCAGSVLDQAGCEEETIKLVGSLILATTHQELPVIGDSAWLTDIDLAILGANTDRFDEYEAQIRAEYAWVANPAFQSGRLRVLENFLARPTIFSTDFFRNRLEAAARTNLARSIDRLKREYREVC